MTVFTSLAPISYCCDAFLFAKTHTIFSNEETFQSDSLAMAMYTIGVDFLYLSLVKQDWYADDSAAGNRK